MIFQSILKFVSIVERVMQFAKRLIFAILLMSIAPGAYAEERVKVLLKWYHQFQFAGFYAAVKEGYYRQYGLDVQLVEGGQEISSDPLPLVLAGEYDFSVASLSLFDAFYRDQPVVVLAQIFQQNPYAFISNNARGIYDFKAFMGKTIVINKGAGDLAYSFLSKMGVQRSDLKVIDVIDPVHAMSNGLIDIFFTYNSSFPYTLSASGIVPFELRPEEYGWNFIGDSLITRRDLLDRRPDLVRNFVLATLKGWNFALDNPDQIISYILGLKTKKPYAINYEMLRFEAKKIDQYISRDLMEVGHIHLKRWENLYKKYCDDQDKVCKDTNLERFFYIDSRDYQKYFNVSSLGVLVLLSLICIFSFFIIQLRRIVKKRTQQMVGEIAHRRQKERELKMNDYAISLALEGGGVGFFDLKPPFHNMKTNEQFSLQMGYSAENFHETLEHWVQSMHPDDRENFVSHFDNAKNGKSNAFDCELRILHAQGYWKWLLCRGRVVEWSGDKSPQRILGILLDIHDLKNAAEKAGHLGQQQCALFSSMGHEIRTPMNSIMGFAELLIDEVDQIQRTKYVAQIAQSSSQLLRITSGLIEIARVDFEGQELKKNIFNPKLLLQKVFDVLNQKQLEREHLISYDPLHPLPRWIKAEEMAISHVLFLFGDYIQRLQIVGKIKISVEYGELISPRGQLKIIYSFHANNFNPDDFIRLFNGQWPGWHHWDNHGNRDFALTIAKRLMDLIGGRFSLSTSKNGESLYSLTFNVSQDEQEYSDQVEHKFSYQTAKLSEKVTVLVVDDDDASAVLAQTMIEKFGGIVEIVKDGLSAIKIAQQRSFDIILMDIQLIGLDGIEVSKILRNKGILTPIIALSAHTPEQFNKNILNSAFSDFLHKPVGGKELFKSINNICAQKK